VLDLGRYGAEGVCVPLVARAPCRSGSLMGEQLWVGVWVGECGASGGTATLTKSTGGTVVLSGAVKST
jgi:hypothetical protein